VIQIYNSLIRKKEEFAPQVPGEVKMYTCGVTVYDDCHVGHARSLYIFDVIRRYFEYRGFKVDFVRNITDIDDKIINRANELKVDWQELVEKYIAGYYRDLESLGVRRGDSEPRATKNIEGMIKYIQALVDKGFAYAAGGDVYFAVRKFSGYGKLSGQAIDEMEKGVRIDPSENKKDPLDFALWKKSKEGEPSWPSPWGSGRPGWHIECSVMSQDALKTDTLDIHAGGRDLIFPHHENEIAQAEAKTGKPFAKYWIHHGLLTINGQKMSKSLGNFYTIQDVLKKVPADVLKFFFLSAHYTSALDFSFEALETSHKGYKKILDFLESARVTGAGADPVSKNFEDRFQKAMDDDFNTAQALAVLFEMAGAGNKALAAGDMVTAGRIADELVNFGKIFGLSFKSSTRRFTGAADLKASVTVKRVASLLGDVMRDEKGSVKEVLSEEEIERFVRERKEARARKDFKRADEIRDALKKHGIIVEDKEKIR
jgi:cysteinyl-tRNA synthetase